MSVNNSQKGDGTMGILAAVEDPATVSEVLLTNTTNFVPEMLAVAGVGLGIGVVVLLLRRGWRLFKGFLS